MTVGDMCTEVILCKGDEVTAVPYEEPFVAMGSSRHWPMGTECCPGNERPRDALICSH